jgi:peptidoglycan/LPS O-acetylase OafA/YrhL
MLNALAKDKVGHSERLGAIDPVRFLAAIAVLLFHYAFRGSRADDMSRFGVPAMEAWAAYGHYGVHLFFVISGFVIGMTARKSSIRTFAISRITRLYPAFWIGCTLTCIAMWTLQDPRYHVSFLSYLINMTLLAGFTQLPHVSGIPYVDGVYWSLTEEIRFYLIVAAAMWLVARSPKWFPQRNRVLLGISCWLLIASLGLWRTSFLLEFLFTPRWAAFFAFGVLCFLLYEGKRGLWLSLILLWSFSLMLAYSREEMVRLAAHYQFEYQWPVVGGILLSICGFFLLIGLRKLGSFRFPRSGLVLGSLTYPIYLIHQNIGYLLFNSLYDGHRPVLWLAGMGVVVTAVAYLIAQHLEKPLMRALRRRLINAVNPPTGLVK